MHSIIFFKDFNFQNEQMPDLFKDFHFHNEQMPDLFKSNIAYLIAKEIQ